MNFNHSFRSDTGLAVHARGSGLSDMRDEVLRGLGRPRKELPAKLFYDDIGSQLFDQIGELDEYYLTRTETAILRSCAGEIASRLGSRCLLVEYGSGSSLKTRILLDRLVDPAGYIAIDISGENLRRSTAALAAEYPGLDVIPVHADYTSVIVVPPVSRLVSRRVGFFPGSTIGNLYPEEVVTFLKRVAALVGSNGALIVGVDLKKDPAVLNRAYNDGAGVTAAFNLNMLARINRQLGADFRLDLFEHHAFYNEGPGRIEMHLISRADQTVHIGEAEFCIRADESILTEVSYKYTPDEFERLALEAGFRAGRVWTDVRRWFSVQYLIAQ